MEVCKYNSCVGWGHCCWILVLQMMYCLMAYSKKKTFWWPWNIHWFGNKQIEYVPSSDTFSCSLHGDAPATNTDWWWFMKFRLHKLLCWPCIFFYSPFWPFHKNELPTFINTHFFLKRLLLGRSFVELRCCSWHRLRLGSSATSEGHYRWTVQSVDLCTGVAVGLQEVGNWDRYVIWYSRSYCFSEWWLECKIISFFWVSCFSLGWWVVDGCFCWGGWSLWKYGVTGMVGCALDGSQHAKGRYAIK